jgi:hypothetical protein
LIDPDFLFLNKFDVEELVLKGKPAAAKYGLGAQVSFFNTVFSCLVPFFIVRVFLTPNTTIGSSWTLI